MLPLLSETLSGANDKLWILIASVVTAILTALVTRIGTAKAASVTKLENDKASADSVTALQHDKASNYDLIAALKRINVLELEAREFKAAIAKCNQEKKQMRAELAAICKMLVVKKKGRTAK